MNENPTKFYYFIPNKGMKIGSKIHIFESENWGKDLTGQYTDVVMNMEMHMQ